MTSKKSKSRIVFEIVNVIIMLFLMFIMVYPLIFIVNASFSDSNALLRHGASALWKPLEPTLSAYKMAFSNKLIVSGYINTVFLVVTGTLISIIMSSLCAYVLSKKDLKLKGLFTKIIMVTMFFGGGLIPTYVLVKNLGMLNTYWSLLIPGAISTYNMIILRTGFESVPDSLTESALMDGAGHLRILFKIVMPLSKATIAVICLYYAVGQWNSWFPASIYIQRDTSKWPLQLVLRQILIMNDVNTSQEVAMDQQNSVAESIKYATIVIATAPVLCVYPFIQKYFTKGVLIGAVKG